MKLISLNIELDTHYDRFIPFVIQEEPDVLCLQEIFEDDVVEVAQKLSLKNYTFKPMAYRPKRQSPDKLGLLGVATFSRTEFLATDFFYYSGSESVARDNSVPSPDPMDNLVVLVTETCLNNIEYRICNTHFRLSPMGLPDDNQRRDLETLLKYLDNYGNLVLVGDMNAPRGRETFSKIATAYTDNIPSHYTSSLDPKLHRSAPLEYVVDVLFTSDNYKTNNCRLQDGVSDHQAVVADVYYQ